MVRHRPEGPLETARSQGWWRDPWLWSALLAGLVLRAVPLVLWGTKGCTRDECLYKVMGLEIARGNGLEPQEGWLWAPGYPYLLAFFEVIDGIHRVKAFQVVVGAALAAVVYVLADRLAGRRAARIAAFAVALHPTLIFFANTLWTETIYGFLLASLVAAVGWAREGRDRRAVLPGVLLGLCVLFRGVALWMAPIAVVALLWPDTTRWKRAGAMLAVAAVLVAPWSIHASRTHGGFVVSDASLGQVLFVGDNRYPPYTYDIGNGVTGKAMADRHVAKGRKHCDEALPPAAWNRCEVSNGVAWIRANPGEFAARIPRRLAQLANPNTFLTRHVRLGDWYGLPFAVKEALVALTAAVSIAVMLGGAVGMWARARGPLGVFVVGVTAYYVAIVAALFGLSRFRVPLEPLWIVYVAAAAADPKGTLEALRGPRGVGMAVTVIVLAAFIGWYLPAGWPVVWR